MIVLCYRCGEYGHMGYGWVESRYRVKDEPEDAILGIEARKKGYGKPYARYRKYYIRHYSHKEYERNMEKYRSHKIKSRPNGQKRCYISPQILFCPYGEKVKQRDSHLDQGVQNELLDYCAAYCRCIQGLSKKRMPWL